MPDTSLIWTDQGTSLWGAQPRGYHHVINNRNVTSALHTGHFSNLCCILISCPWKPQAGVQTRDTLSKLCKNPYCSSWNLGSTITLSLLTRTHHHTTPFFRNRDHRFPNPKALVQIANQQWGKRHAIQPQPSPVPLTSQHCYDDNFCHNNLSHRDWL